MPCTLVVGGPTHVPIDSTFKLKLTQCCFRSFRSSLSLALSSPMTSFLLAAASCAATLSPVEIANGVMMPAMNLGHPDDSSSVSSGVQLWTEVGGRGIDTAYDYRNQDQVAAGVKAEIANGVGREELFITTKISPSTCSREAALQAVQEDVKELAGIKPDLVLHHFPCSSGRHHASGSNAAVWQGLQDALAQGLTRAIGVSNYAAGDIDEVLAVGGVPPAVNQCQMSVGSHDDATIKYCQRHNITYEAYSPLRRVDLTDSRITKIANNHNATTAQVALRWINQQGVVIATSPGMNREYALADLAIGDFRLGDDEMSSLSAI